MKKKITKFSTSHEYCQENAWMNNGAMIEMIDNILKPKIAYTLENIMSLLVLDSYYFYMITLVVEAIQQLGIVVEHIPGGCTSL